MSEVVRTQHQAPWLDRANSSMERVAQLARTAVVVCACVGVGVLIVWFVVGMLTGYLSVGALVGTGGAAGLIKTVKNVATKGK